jgi:hypothetical protein
MIRATGSELRARVHVAREPRYRGPMRYDPGGNMIRASAVLATLAVCAGAAGASVDFDRFFIDRTMRVDYFHTGGMGQEIYAVDRIVSDGQWAGSTSRLLDDLNLGKYLFTVVDQQTNRAIYSRGFASLYGEWETIPEAAVKHRTFHESLRFPWPRRPVRVIVEKRDEANHFRPVWSLAIDPSSRFVNPADPASRGSKWAVMENGDPKQKVDLLILGDGYASSEMEKFHADAIRLTEVLFGYEPFKSRRGDFNVWAIDLPATESGVSRPRAGQFRRTPLSAQYNVFDSERYVLTNDNRTLRDVAAGVPYEFIEILVNEEQYGGGGIFNFQATASVRAGYANYLFVHEFGHHFAGLGDEYYTSEVAYETGRSDLPEPWEPNVTALGEPERLKWGDLIEEGTPLPTPWKKEEWERSLAEYQKKRRALRAKNVPEGEMDKLFDELKAWSTPFLANHEHGGKVGAFEGAGYEAKGLYRPELDCIMFTRDDVGFCRVCQRAIERVIDLYSR